MNDLKSLFIGILGSLIVLVLVPLFTQHRKRKLNNDIELLRFEKEHLETIKRSSVEMHRSSFRSIFILLFIFGIANLSPYLFSFFAPMSFEKLSNWFSLVIWAVFVITSYQLWQRYDNLKNYKSAITKIDAKIKKLQSKLSNNE